MLPACKHKASIGVIAPQLRAYSRTDSDQIDDLVEEDFEACCTSLQKYLDKH